MHFLTALSMSSTLVLASLPAQAENSRMWDAAAKFSGVPRSVIYGIALQESKLKYPDGLDRPYPWTLNVNGDKPRSMRLPSREAAEKALRQLIDSGITNVDVGHMQVNYRFHGHSVKRAEDLLDPKTNLFVAAVILRELKEVNRGDLAKVVADYHSRTPTKGVPYAQSVLGIVDANHKRLKQIRLGSNL